ncbi:hypothetical protein [Clostridium chromiireducens]|uniref:hypothetical protein n=1 Tax=Clostridium chromiireducens TaxID=225345 RepID=UPI001A9AC71F|nr:hypothetical protein [Clostridium chromiireducens]
MGKLHPFLHVPVASTGQAKTEQLPIKIFRAAYFSMPAPHICVLFLCFAITLGLLPIPSLKKCGIYII